MQGLMAKCRIVGFILRTMGNNVKVPQNGKDFGQQGNMIGLTF